MNVMNYALRVYWAERFNQDFPLGAIKRDDVLRYELNSHIFILSGALLKMAAKKASLTPYLKLRQMVNC